MLLAFTPNISLLAPLEGKCWAFRPTTNCELSYNEPRSCWVILPILIQIDKQKIQQILVLQQLLSFCTATGVFSSSKIHLLQCKKVYSWWADTISNCSSIWKDWNFCISSNWHGLEVCKVTERQASKIEDWCRRYMNEHLWNFYLTNKTNIYQLYSIEIHMKY